MGGSWYSRAHGSALFKLEKMLARIGVGVDGLPEHIRNSEQITGKELGLLGSLDKIPNQEEIDSQVSKLQSQEITLDGARIELTRGDLTKAFILFNHCLQQ
jgi:hypothetical protein